MKYFIKKYGSHITKYQEEDGGLFTVVTLKRRICHGCDEAIPKKSLVLREWGRRERVFYEYHFCEDCYVAIDEEPLRIKVTQKPFRFPTRL